MSARVACVHLYGVAQTKQRERKKNRSAYCLVSHACLHFFSFVCIRAFVCIFHLNLHPLFVTHCESRKKRRVRVKSKTRERVKEDEKRWGKSVRGREIFGGSSCCYPTKVVSIRGRTECSLLYCEFARKYVSASCRLRDRAALAEGKGRTGKKIALFSPEGISIFSPLYFSPSFPFDSSIFTFKFPLIFISLLFFRAHGSYLFETLRPRSRKSG